MDAKHRLPRDPWLRSIAEDARALRDGRAGWRLGRWEPVVVAAGLVVLAAACRITADRRPAARALWPSPTPAPIAAEAPAGLPVIRLIPTPNASDSADEAAETEETDGAPPPTSVVVTEPSSAVEICPGEPLRIAWEVLHGPAEPSGWKVQVALAGCVWGYSNLVIDTEPLVLGEDELSWTAPPEMLDKLERENCGRCEMPVEVLVYEPRDPVVGELMEWSRVCKAVGSTPTFVRGWSRGTVYLEDWLGPGEDPRLEPTPPPNPSY
jgi:hypothetical protein